MLFIKSIIFSLILVINSVCTYATDFNSNHFSDKSPGPKFSSQTVPAALSPQFSDGTCILRSPSTSEEWNTYHKIRLEEIVDRYCANDYVYNPAHPDELSPTNFRFVLFHILLQRVLGVIRVDLLEEKGESSIRWVAIEKAYQKQGYGTCMLNLVECFVSSQNRNLIRVPSEEAAKDFYVKFGFVPTDWPKAPQDDGQVFLSKIVLMKS